MPELQTLRVTEDGGVVTVSLDRSAVHNAFNDRLIVEMIGLLERLASRRDVRVMVLRGEGPNFCAGADLNWMSQMVSYSREENIRDSTELANMFRTLDRAPFPIVGRVHGAAIGGGVGLVAVCDIVIAEEGTKFGLSEVKLGILPAVISPYVIAKIGRSHARALFLTGERFGAGRAAQIGLIHRIASGLEDLDRLVAETVAGLMTSGPQAVAECKKLIAHVGSRGLDESVPYTVDAIAARRTSEEGQAGMRAFLEKRKAPWIEE